MADMRNSSGVTPKRRAISMRSSSVSRLLRAPLGRPFGLGHCPGFHRVAPPFVVTTFFSLAVRELAMCPYPLTSYAVVNYAVLPRVSHRVFTGEQRSLNAGSAQ